MRKEYFTAVSGQAMREEKEAREVALSEFTIKLVEKKLSRFCLEKVPEMHRHKVRLGFKIEGDIVTLFEERPMFSDPLSWVTLSVAQFRYAEKKNTWTLYFPDRDNQWRVYYLDPKADFEILLKEVDEDPLRIFWE
jgi:hypothetical protein